MILKCIYLLDYCNRQFFTVLDDAPITETNYVYIPTNITMLLCIENLHNTLKVLEIVKTNFKHFFGIAMFFTSLHTLL